MPPNTELDQSMKDLLCRMIQESTDLLFVSSVSDLVETTRVGEEWRRYESGSKQTTIVVKKTVALPPCFPEII